LAIQTNECPNCLLSHPGEPEKAKIRREGAWVKGRALPTVIICGVALLLLANIGVAVHSRLKQKKDERLFYYWCPKCSRKLRYRVTQIGRLANCPLCERPILFPKPEGFVDSRWVRLRRWLHLDPPAEKRRV
jgi:hypothetical protein